MGFSEMLWDAEKLVPAEYWCSYGTITILFWKMEMGELELPNDAIIICMGASTLTAICQSLTPMPS